MRLTRWLVLGFVSAVSLAVSGVFPRGVSRVSLSGARPDPGVFLSGRSDTRLTAVFGACVEGDFRQFTLWDAPAWDTLRWTTSGNLYPAKAGWPEKEDSYSQSLILTVDGRPVERSAMKVTQVEHQFDCRLVRGQIGGLDIERVDLVVSSLQLKTGLKLRNNTGRPVRLGIETRWEGGRPLGLTPWPKGYEFVLDDPGGPATLVSCDKPLRPSSNGGKVEASGVVEVAPGGQETWVLTCRIGWGPITGAGRKMCVPRTFPSVPVYEVADPAIPCDPGFRSVETARDHPLDYVLKVPAGGRYRVVFGLIENTYARAGERILDLIIDGKTVETVDLAATRGKNIPVIAIHSARDADGDGVLEVGVHASKKGRVPDPLFSSIRVFKEEDCPSAAEILSGGIDARALAFVRADRPERPTRLSAGETAEKKDVEIGDLHRILGVAAGPTPWLDLERLCEAKKRALCDRMPRLEGFDTSWSGAWTYIFDILRAGTYPAQGECLGPWMEGDLIWYRWTFYWDTALSAHTFVNWDPGLAARTVETFLKGERDDGALPIHFNPTHVMPIRPQLPNIGMALWDAYQAGRDRSVIEETYPLLARHQRWLDRKWNKTPDGPLADTEFNNDYGTPLLEGRTIWVDMNVFQVDQYRALASMARMLGKGEEAAGWDSRADRLAEAVRRLMWDGEKGGFFCVNAKTMERLKIGSPVEFFTMTTGVASREQAEKLIARVRDPRKYAPGPKYPFAIPSAPFDDPTFTIQDGWGGTIWPVQAYYTVRGLVRYGYQDDAALIARNIFGMVAAEFARTGTVWEQYRPDNGRGIHLGLFTSGITVSVSDMLLRGLFGFERTDDPLAFFLAPTPVGDEWQGVTNLQLGGGLRLDLRAKKAADGELCRVRVYGLPKVVRAVEVLLVAGNRKEVLSETQVTDAEIEFKLPRKPGERYLVKLSF